MNITKDVEIFESPEYGCVLLYRNLTTADYLEDFLTEQCYVLFNISINDNETLFFFGQASSEVKVKEIYESFKQFRVAN